MRLAQPALWFVGVVVSLAAACASGRRRPNESTVVPAVPAFSVTDKNNTICTEWSASYIPYKDAIKSSATESGKGFSESPCPTDNAIARCTQVIEDGKDGEGSITVGGTIGMVYYEGVGERDEMKEIYRKACVSDPAKNTTATFVDL